MEYALKHKNLAGNSGMALILGSRAHRRLNRGVRARQE